MAYRLTAMVAGERYWFKVSTTLNSRNCTVRQFGRDEEFPATIVGLYVILDKPLKLKGKQPLTTKLLKVIKIDRYTYRSMDIQD